MRKLRLGWGRGGGLVNEKHGQREQEENAVLSRAKPTTASWRTEGSPKK